MSEQKMVGGTHYLALRMQPLEFAMKNGWDNAAFSILKYLSRHGRKNGVEDLRKADHFVSLRCELIEHVGEPRRQIPMQTYCDLNGITGADRQMLMVLEDFVLTPANHYEPGSKGRPMYRLAADNLSRMIQGAIGLAAS